MILCLDVGNSHFYGGVYDEANLLFSFRHSSQGNFTSDQLGIFFKNVLRENNFQPENIKQIVYCSVMPSFDYSIEAAFIKYFDIQPFALRPGSKTGLKIKYKNPIEVGADRIANAIAAIELFPEKNLIVIDFGTATTFDAITLQREYLGGVIIPGMKISMESLYKNTAKLAAVNIIQPEKIIGQTTSENIQSGLYYGHLGAMYEIIKQISAEAFQNEIPLIIGTGGFAQLFRSSQVFSLIIPDLVLQGLRIALEKNMKILKSL